VCAHGQADAALTVAIKTVIDHNRASATPTAAVDDNDFTEDSLASFISASPSRMRPPEPRRGACVGRAGSGAALARRGDDNIIRALVRSGKFEGLY
jgi:hypothetical protein